MSRLNLPGQILFPGSWKSYCHDGFSGEPSASEAFQLNLQLSIYSVMETADMTALSHRLGFPHSLIKPHCKSYTVQQRI